MSYQFILDRHLDLTVPQIRALAALLEGATLSDAASRAGVHRSTVGEWRESNSLFRTAFIDAKHWLMATELDRLQKLSALALDNLEKVMSSEKTSPATLLRASLAVLTRLKGTEIQGWALPHVHHEAHYRYGEHHRLAAETNATEEDLEARQDPSKSDTNSDFPRPQPVRAEKVGRNQPCPCRSGRKFKHCCLNKPRPTPSQEHSQAA